MAICTVVEKLWCKSEKIHDGTSESKPTITYKFEVILTLAEGQCAW